MYLINWNYTKAEWKSFLFRKNSKNIFSISLIKYLLRFKQRNIHEIRITNDTVFINNEKKQFRSTHIQFRGVQILEAENINILEIRYTRDKKIRKIKIPIPKGKLKEAFEVQEKILNNEIL